MKYLKDDGNIIPHLLDTEAQKAAKSFITLRMVGEIDKQNSIKTSQLRKFYGEVKTLERKWNNNKSQNNEELAFAMILPMFKLLKAKSSYAKERKVVPEAFKNWIWDNVDSVKNHRDFEAFVLYFEAVVGFCYGLGLRD